MSVLQASQQYSVSYTTLNDTLHNRHPLSYGRQTVLNTEEDKDLVAGIMLCATWGFPLRASDVSDIV
ncbi:hypothetical protein ANN_10720 [Periplaneta americana]|uniref:Uncharacterized protein n=1 Tax=Periplaneta americana TaxID=6978 RepID=A0ABQ8T3R7_PERAM|nr:hypothetical protein ANN_10720 [Periplaneta americana]